MNYNCKSNMKGGQSSQSGFVALISAVIITALLITLSIAVSQGGYFARFNELANESKKISYSLAEACGNTALLDLAKDDTYAPSAGGDEIAVGNNSCKICEVVSDPSDDTIKTVLTRASYQDSVTNIKIVADYTTDDYSVDFWGEEAGYSGSASCILQ